MPGIYKSFKKYDVPKTDLLTLLFDSEYTAVQESATLCIDAANPSNSLTKADIRQLTEQFAHGLRHRYDIGANGPYKDTVVYMTTGQILVPVLFYAIMAAGGVASPASPSFTAAELARQVKQSMSNLLIVSADLKDIGVEAAKIAGVPSNRVLILQSSPQRSLKSVEGSVECRSDQRLTWRRVTDPGELKKSLILLLYSSGTTGVPKGVMLSHLNLVTEIFIPFAQAKEWMAANAPDAPPVELRTLAHLPVSHIAGVLGYTVSPLWTGCAVYWMRKYEWRSFLEYSKKYQITTLYTVPSIFLRIAKSPDVTDHFKSLLNATTGAALMDQELQRGANARLGVGATFIGQTWGLSETTGAVTFMPRGEMDDTGSISPIMPGMEMRLVDDQGQDVEPGQQGEIWVRGDIVTNGYYNNPTATKDSFHDDWFCTGDIAIDRGGKFYIVDRKKEILKYKGAQIAPAELEGVLDTHPQILEAAVVGVPIGGGDEAPRAYVVADPKKVSVEEIKAFMTKHLAPYKQLRGGVVYVDELPKNAIGKILRRELREQAKMEMQRERSRL